MDKLFTDKASGKDTRRPELERGCPPSLLKRDTWWCTAWIVWRATSTTCAGWCSRLTHRGVRIEFVKEHLTFTGEDSATDGELMLSVMGAFAEFERALIRERQREGIALAKQRGAWSWREEILPVWRIAELRQRVEAGEQNLCWS